MLREHECSCSYSKVEAGDELLGIHLLISSLGMQGKLEYFILLLWGTF